MDISLIFLWIILGFVSMGFWEAYIEGKHPWAERQVGWRKKIFKNFVLTAYHFWVFVMLIFFLTLPLVVFGWDLKLLGIIISASAIGLVIEDLTWFIANPFYSLRRFNSKDAKWYPWLKIWKFELPVSYIIGVLVSFLAWYFLWR